MITLLCASISQRLLLQLATTLRFNFARISMTEYLAALAALAVFVAIQRVFLRSAAERQREAARRQWLDELRTKGA
jgi:hypothetical protein